MFTAPVEETVNGTVTFNLPSLSFGREVNGVSLTFRDGCVVEASAKKGESFLVSQLDLDEGARRLGEFAIGNNWGIERVTGSTLLDEKIGGTIHMALGASLPDTGGVNESRLHWDMVHDMEDGGEIEVDGEIFYRSGKFLNVA
jgi:aminopeptidase